MTASEAHTTAAAIAADPAVTHVHHARAAELMTLALGVGVSADESRALMAAKLADWTRHDLADAAGILLAPTDNAKRVVHRLIWRRAEGSNHGPGQTWEEYAELCALECAEAEAAAELGIHLLDRAKECCVDGRIDSWTEGVLTKAAELGVGGVRRVIYDPACHGEIAEAEPGYETWFWGEEQPSKAEVDALMEKAHVDHYNRIGAPLAPPAGP